ncbi:MAG: SgcJ/EcaC family oxidoreductase [Acidobacteria bacterium]|nr:SgcJ/EcaC family oxidoreductase [Acidobacteriota bacterium]
MPATSPEQLHRLFEEAFNAGDLDALLALYEPDAALIPEPGVVVHGVDQIGPALKGFLDVGGKMKLDTKEVVIVGDLAYLMNRWSLTATNEDGSPLEMGAVTAEVARRQADGSWLYVIDNAVGDLAAGD